MPAFAIPEKVLWLALLPLFFGYLLATRVLQVERLLTALALAMALATALTLVPLNFLLVSGVATVQLAVWLTLALQALATLALLKLPARRPGWQAEQTRALLPLALIYLSALAFRLMSPDDDYWIHMPTQGSLQTGLFPPRNPFFVEVVLNGHYGRNLLMAGLGLLLGCYTFWLEIMITPLWMAAIYVLFWDGLYRKDQPEWVNHVPPLMVFFGVNCGLNSGLTSLPINNNPVVHLYLGCLLWLFLCHRRFYDQGLRCWPVGLLWGLVLGSYAILYETHFGLCVLATASVSLLWQFRWQRFFHLLLPASLAAVLAITQGGPLTVLAQGKHDASQLSQGMQGHSQVVKLTFPKKDLFQIKLFSDNNPRNRLSMFYAHFGPASWRQLRPQAGYTPIYHWEFLKLHFLPTYLAPLTLLLLWRQRDLAGLWLWFFAFWAFLVPAVVDFGDIYESEYMRWQFAAALGWSACLALQLGRLRGVGWLLLLCFLPAFPTLSSQWAHFRSWPGPRHWLIWPPANEWLHLQGDLAFAPKDLEMALSLRTQGRPGERFLCDSNLDSPALIHYESTLAGLSGLRCVGHTFPLDHEEIGLPPYHFGPAALGFWAHHSPWLLQQLGIQWLVRRVPEGSPDLEGFPPPERFSDGTIERQLYHLREFLPADPRNYLRAAARQEAGLTLESPASAQGNQVYQARASHRLPYWTSLVSEHDLQLSPREWLWNPPGETIAWAAPSAEGDYRLQLYGQDASGVFPVKEASLAVKVDVRRRLSQLTGEFRLRQSQALPNQVVCLEALFHPLEPPPSHGFFALQFDPVDSGTLVDPLQGMHKKLQRLPFRSGVAIEVHGQAPPVPGRYRCDLVFSPDYTRLRRFPAGHLEVSP